MEGITASEIAGLGVGALLLSVTIAAPKVDAFISASQRSSLGLCKKCGDLRMTACSKCKGTGSVKKRDAFSFNLMEDKYKDYGSFKSKDKFAPCLKCQARGYFSCSDCSNISKLLNEPPKCRHAYIPPMFCPHKSLTISGKVLLLIPSQK